MQLEKLCRNGINQMNPFIVFQFQPMIYQPAFIRSHSIQMVNNSKSFDDSKMNEWRMISLFEKFKFISL